MIRTRQFNPKVAFKYRRPKLRAANRLDIYRSIEAWWRGRLKDGCQLTNLRNYVLSYDYRGNSPWFTHVSTQALFYDYRFANNNPATLRTFLRYFYEITNHPKRITMPAQLMSNGQKFMRPRRCFVRFKEWDYYAELDYNRGLEENER